MENQTPDYLTPALVSTAGNLLGNIFNVQSQAATNAANMKLAEYQYEKNLEQWYRQNDYNLPINQMARLRQAGINPVMAFSSGQVSGNVSASSPQYERAELAPYHVDASGTTQIMNQYIQAKQSEKYMELMESQKDLNEVKAATENMTALLRELQGNKQWMDNQYFAEVAPILKEVLEANRDLLSSRKELTDTQKDLGMKELELFPLKQDYLRSSISNLDQRTRTEYFKMLNEKFTSILNEELSNHAFDIANDKADILDLQRRGLNKLNSIRDLEAVFKQIRNEQLPIELRIKMLEAIFDGLRLIAPSGGSIPMPMP